MCLHLTAVGRTWPESYPEQRGLEPGQVRCLGCGAVFASDRAWCAAQDEQEAARRAGTAGEAR